MSDKKPTDIITAIKQKGQSLEAEMSFFDHLEELRWHLIRSVAAILVFTVVAFCYYDFIFGEIIMGPKKPEFWTYRMMCQLAERFDLGDGFCIKEIPFNIINTELSGQFTLQMNSSLLMGLVFGIPYLLFEVWRFVKPGLTDKESSAASGFVIYASLLFLVGLLFGYYIIAPLSVSFLANYTVSSIIQNQITIDSYLSTVGTLSIGTGITFELPIIIYILSKLGLMTPAFMRASRRYAIVIILVIAAVVTPTPDMLPMITITLPLYLLFEMSIIVSARVERKRQKAELDFYKRT
ncbi:twin-arginine translocase subunit TatC [Desertivirga brevis]|uniref:twin-arginine translocase subunit TatC n=1 Tax=Desertivirga brevis TaxID=2810310 RepID=UPI001A975AE6|nr:twin-arginine translocase subunit TatC [Pedobacter sp. SYSU D00873]